MKTTEVTNLYLGNWQYNAALILTELETIVKNNGGKICKTWSYGNPPTWITERKKYSVVNSTLIKAIHEARERVQRLETFSRTEAIPAAREELKQLESIDNLPKVLYHGEYLYLNFTLNGNYYCYQLDSNPFFEFYYTKRAITNNNQVNNCCYSDADNKKWWKDILYSFKCTREERHTAALFIFNMLISAADSRTHSPKNKKQYTTIYYTGD